MEKVPFICETAWYGCGRTAMYDFIQPWTSHLMRNGFISTLSNFLVEVIPWTGWPSLNCEFTSGMACTLCSVASLFLISIGLADLHSGNVRDVMAALLVEDGGRRRRRIASRDVFHEDDDVGQLAGRPDHHFLVHLRSGMLGRAVRIGAHLHGSHLRAGAFELHRPAQSGCIGDDGSGSGRSGRAASRVVRGGGGRGVIVFAEIFLIDDFLPTATGPQQKDTENKGASEQNVEVLPERHHYLLEVFGAAVREATAGRRWPSPTCVAGGVTGTV